MSRAQEIADLLAGVTITTADNNPQITLTSTDADASAGPLIKMHRNSSSPADGDALGRFNFIGENDASEEVTYARIHAKANDVTDGEEDGDLLLLTTVAGTNRSRMAIGPSETVFNEDSVDVDFRVESNGDANMLFVDGGNNRVGIGTGSPVNILDVIGNGSGAAVKGRIRNEGGASGDDATLELSIATASEEMRILFTDSGGTAGQIVVDGGDNSMAFETGTSERARFDTNGKFLINTTSLINNDGAHLQCNGGTNLAFGFNVNADQTLGRFYRSGSIVGSISVDTSNTTYATSSDRRLKSNIQDAESASDKIDAIQVRQFDWNVDNKHQDYGLIAQELEPIESLAVTGDADGEEMMGVDYGKLVPMLIKEIQELRSRVATLEAS